MKEEKYYYVYINTNRWNSVLYTGVTNNLLNRNYQHKSKDKKSFTAKYKADKLVYYELFNNINDAISREKQIKSGSRKKKIELIKTINQKWRDLSEDLCS